MDYNYFDQKNGNSSTSTVTSSVFSENVDYNNQLKEIEDYYYKTLLNEDADLNQSKSNDNLSEASSVDDIGYNFQYNSYNSSPSNTFDYAAKDSYNQRKLEVQINSSYFNAINSLPLTTKNLQKLSSIDAKKSLGDLNKKSIKIVNTTVNDNVNLATNYAGANINKQLFKTELCETFTTKGFCKYGNKCQFAHGLNELNLKQQTNNFRTKPCINWSKLGYCPYGKRCCFKHGDDSDIEIYKKAGLILIDKNTGISQTNSNNVDILHHQNQVDKATQQKQQYKKNLHASIVALQKMTW